MKQIVKVNNKRQSLTLVDDIVYKSLKDENPLDLHMSLLLHNVNVERKILVDKEKHDYRFPLILCLPGGGFTHCERNRIIPECQFLADDGYLIASIDYRLSDSYSFPSQIIDVYDALKYLINNADIYHIDINNIGILGRSAGATLALMAGMNCYLNKFTKENNNISIKAVCSMYGLTCLEKMLDYEIDSQNFSKAKRYSETIVGKLIKADEDKIKEKALNISPITNINKNMADILMLHGDNDPIIPVNQARDFYNKIVKCRLEDKVNYYEIIGAGHGSKEFFQEEIQKIIINFFNTNLKGD